MAWLVLSLSLTGAGAGAGAQGSDSQAPVRLEGAGPFYRLSVPTSIHAYAASEDLRDVRVRNAAGHAVPFAWLDPDAGSAPVETASQKAPVFAVPSSGQSAASGRAPGSRADAGSTDIALGLRLRPDGSLALAASRGGARPPTPDSAPIEWLIDASRVKGDLVQVTLSLAATAQGVFPYMLDASDDLRRWRRLLDNESLVRLDRGAEHIERMAVELSAERARYLRLRWLDPNRAPVLEGALLDSVRAAAAPLPALEWSAEVGPSSCAADHCDYLAPRNLPLESLRVSLAEINTLARAQLLAVSDAGAERRAPRNPLFVLRDGNRARDAARARAEWPLVDAVLYRLAQPGGGELRSAPLALDGAAHGVLRLRTVGDFTAAFGQTPPRLSFGARPRALVFLARGEPPFALSWRVPGNVAAPTAASDGPAAVPLAVLMPSALADTARTLAAASAFVELPRAPVVAARPPPVPATAPSSSPSTRPWLWATLALGFALLVAMAVTLLRSQRTGKTREGGRSAGSA